jgi:hypothetical protein
VLLAGRSLRELHSARGPTFEVPNGVLEIPTGQPGLSRTARKRGEVEQAHGTSTIFLKQQASWIHAMAFIDSQWQQLRPESTSSPRIDRAAVNQQHARREEAWPAGAGCVFVRRAKFQPRLLLRFCRPGSGLSRRRRTLGWSDSRLGFGRARRRRRWGRAHRRRRWGKILNPPPPSGHSANLHWRSSHGFVLNRHHRCQGTPSRVPLKRASYLWFGFIGKLA